MALPEGYVTKWQEWHDARISDLNRPHGYMSIVCQDWLPDGEFFTSEFVPGQWLVKDGAIYYYPDEEGIARGDFLTVDGKNATAPTLIPQGHNKNAGTGSAVPIFYKNLEVETLTRVNSIGEKIDAIRVRDPKQAALNQFDDIETFPLSDAWIVPARFRPTEITSTDLATVEATIYETTLTIGTMELVINDQKFSLEVLGHRAGSPESGYFSDLTYVHIGDLTNGRESYGGGRIVALDPDELDNITELDFNRLVSFSCAFTTFAACAPAPVGNRLPFEVRAGEYAPAVDFERIPTYTGPSD
jgi:uncharacterized protein (DUF1684 family)